jgi:MEMO1 family protein
MSMSVRKAVYSGSWYPDTASGCEKQIRSFIKVGADDSLPMRPRIGGIVPHAGWYFSGMIACNVIHSLIDENRPDVFVVFGMHLHPRSANYMMTEGAWETPFGAIEIHSELAGELNRQFDFTIETPERFTQDNTIELQLPFIKYFYDSTKLVSIGVPPTLDSLQIGEAVAQISERMGLSIKIIGSTDLTHYGSNYGFAPKGSGQQAVEWVKNENDRNVIDAMVAMDPERVIQQALANQNACCAGAAATALSAAKYFGATRSETLAYATSYDKNPSDSFVGYVGIVF